MKMWILVLWFLFISTASAQPEHPGDVRIRECLIALDTGGTERGVSEFLKMEREFRGTRYGARALFEAAYWSDPPDNTVLFQRVIDEYPGFGFETASRIYILGFRHGVGRDFVNELDQWAQSIGGPSLAEISSTDEDDLVQRVLTLPQSQQKTLYTLYHTMGLTLTQDMGQHTEALPLVVFFRDAFSSSPWGNGVEDALVELAINRRYVSKIHKVDPVVTISTPDEGEITTPTPTITSTITVGDLTHVQADPSEIQVQIDGQDVKANTRFRSQFSNPPQAGVPFETISVSTTPSSPLAVGQHTYTLVVPIGTYKGEGPGQTIVTRRFIVRTTPPQPTTETKTAIKDALIYEKSPHANEGANPRLTLEKINGKAARNLLGFDLTGVNAQGFTKATLVLSIDPTQQVTGWGNGETVSLKPVSLAWAEGNGRQYGLSGSTTPGSGAGATWFSSSDSDISNNIANSASSWNGGSTLSGAALPQTVRNHQSGEVSFDVTLDVKNGVPNGWLLRKDAENKGSKISFYSKEGAAAAGNPDLAPRLILEYGGSTASLGRGVAAVSSILGLPRMFEISRRVRLQEVASASERPSFRQTLQNHPTVSLIGEQLVFAALSHQPLLELGARSAYQSWLHEGLLAG